MVKKRRKNNFLMFYNTKKPFYTYIQQQGRRIINMKITCVKKSNKNWGKNTNREDTKEEVKVLYKHI